MNRELTNGEFRRSNIILKRILFLYTHTRLLDTVVNKRSEAVINDSKHSTDSHHSLLMTIRTTNLDYKKADNNDGRRERMVKGKNYH